MKFPIRRPKDTVPAMLRPGEGVLVPEATQMLGGRKGISFLNRKAEAQARMPRHFAAGGVAQPVVQGGPVFDPRITPRPMPQPFDHPVASPYPVGSGGYTEPGPLPPPVLRQPMQLPPHVQHFRTGGVSVAGNGPDSGGSGWNGQGLGGVDLPEANMNDPFGGVSGERGRDGGPAWAEAGFDPGMSQYSNWGYNAGFGPGALQGRTMIPTFFDSQGYPYAVPTYGEASVGTRNESIHTPPRHNQ
jgi:hypothetical protein